MEIRRKKSHEEEGGSEDDWGMGSRRVLPSV